MAADPTADEHASTTAILEAVCLAATRFLDRRTSWEDHLPEVLASLARATGTSRVYLFENFREEDGEVWSTQRFEWSAPGVRSIADHPVLAALPMVEAGFGRWVEGFRRGEEVVALRRELPPEEQPQLEDDETLSIAVVPIMVDGVWWGMLGFDECAYERVWAPQEVDALRAAASTIAAAIAASHHDAELRQTHEQLELRLGALSSVAETLTVDADARRVLDELCRVVVEATEAVGATVQLVDPEDRQIHLLGAHGIPEGYAEALAASRAAGAQTAASDVLQDPAPRWLPHARDGALADPLFARLHPFLRVAPWRGLLVLPLDALGRHVGSVSISYPEGVEPDAGERVFLRTVADHAATAVENLRLFGSARDAAALQERHRLARELHDSVSQALYGIALGARTARTLADRDPSAVVEPLDYVLSLAEAGLAEMRALIFELRPEALATEGLVAALERQLQALRARHQLTVDADLGSEPEVDVEVKEALYRVAQEALHNVVKHARATRVDVRLADEGGGALTLRIADDGVGFDPDGSYPGHLGLRSMRERVEALDGELDLVSAAGRGAELTVRLGVSSSAAPSGRRRDRHDAPA